MPVQVKATCVSYGYTEHICEGCNSRYVTDYVKPTGHEYKTEVVEATESTLGYTKNTCLSCGYTFLTDFSTSKDNGYIEVPEEPAPPVHTHSYAVKTEVNKTDKTLFVGLECNCGQIGERVSKVLFTSADGSIIPVSVIDGVANYSNLSGDYTVVIVDDYGNVLKQLSVTADGTSEILPPVENTEGGEVHEHNFTLYSTNVEQQRLYIANYICPCGENKTNELVVVFTGEGSIQTLVPNENGEADYSTVKGNCVAQVINERGEAIYTFNVTAKQEVETPTPEQPDEGKEPTVSGSESTDNGSSVTDEKAEKNNNVIIFVVAGIVVALGITAGIVLVVIKKNAKHKKN